MSKDEDMSGSTFDARRRQSYLDEASYRNTLAQWESISIDPATD